MKPHVWFLVVALVSTLLPLSAADVPSTVLHSGGDLVAGRESFRKGDTRISAAVTLLVAEANAGLDLVPAHLMNGHDYQSLAPYWWPDPSKPDGLPYIHLDGNVYPPSRKADMVPFARTCAAVRTLGLAYWFTGDARYAKKAAELTKIWFLDPDTHMNPNLEHAQAIRGINTGRGTGIIEGRHLLELADGLALISGSEAWTAADETAMQAWFGDYYHWLRTSDHGVAERSSKNNHGSWYDAQSAGLARILGRMEDVKRIALEAETKRIAFQIQPDGSEPLEMARTRSLNYSLFNLEALTTLARISEPTGVDLWSYAAPNGVSLELAIRHVASFVDPAKPWPKKDLTEDDRTRIYPLLIAADHHLSGSPFSSVLSTYAVKPAAGQYWQLEWNGR